MIPVMEREYVDKNHWLDRQEFMDIMVVAQTTPGIFSIDMASHIGYKLRGVWGGIVGALGIALPSIIAILLIAMVALIAAPCFKMARTAHITWSTCWIPVVSCLLIAAFSVSPIWIIIVAGLAGYIYGRVKS